jgi:beta-glucanase (GH16 family)
VTGRELPVRPLMWSGGVVVLLVLALLLWTGLDRTGARTGVPSGPPAGWHQVFADEITGPTLDTATWQPDRGAGEAGAVPFNPGIENAWFDPAQVSVSGGALVLQVAARPRTVQGHRYEYSSGMVQRSPSGPVLPGSYVEARIRVPGCGGCWPAFWLTPFDRWPPEIDIAEYQQSGADRRPSFNAIDPDRHQTGPTPYGRTDVDHRDAFHVYGLLWTADRAVPFLDGVPYPEAATPGPAAEIPLMLVLNLSLRNGWTAPAGAEMQVDWVRVWRPPAAGS